MPIAITVNESRIVEFVGALTSKKPIMPPKGGWTANDTLVLAAVCRFLALVGRPSEWGYQDTEHMHPEHAEALKAKYVEDVDEATAVVSEMARDIIADEYLYAHEVVVVVERRGGERVVQHQPPSTVTWKNPDEPQKDRP